MIYLCAILWLVCMLLATAWLAEIRASNYWRQRYYQMEENSITWFRKYNEVGDELVQYKMGDLKEALEERKKRDPDAPDTIMI